MSGSFDAFTLAERELLEATLVDRDPELLRQLTSTDEPSMAQRERVSHILYDAFSEQVSGPEWEPTPLGKRLDDLLGAFFLHYPLERE